MSALAIVSLGRHALLVLSPSAPVALLLSGYAALMRGAVGWAERLLQEVLTALGGAIGWQPTLEPHWRDMLVVVATWIGALVWARWRYFAARWSVAGHDGMFGFQHIVAFAFAFLVLTVGGLLMVLVVGLLPIRSFDLSVQMVVATAPWLVFGIVMWLGGLVRRNEALGVLIFAGIAAAATWWLTQSAGSASGLGIAGFAVSVVAVGLMYLAFGVALLLSGQPFATSPGIYGLYIIGSFANAGVLLGIDAGLKRLFG